MQATYSPEDNKLRLYPAHRLDSDDYARVKAAGFKWAPKQELFVAPMWTPGREDLLLEMAGEIGDEDTSLVDRAEAKADRLEDLSDKRRDDAKQAHKAVDAIAGGIPLGQPILVGHHSEKWARKDAAKIEGGMRKAVRCWDLAQYWKDRAAGAVRHAKYKERPDVRARRIKKIEADQRKQKKEHDAAEMCRRFWAGELKKKSGGAFGVNQETAVWFANQFDHLSCCFPLAEFPRELPASQYEGQMSLWSALTDEIITPEQAAAIAIPAHQRRVAHADRWLAHCANRLAYERAMLEDQGGTVADRTGPEKGGAVRCWASPAHGRGWSYIKRVNRVSVTVEDNWGNGGRNFTRTIPFDKLGAVMTAAQVQEARESGRLVETDDKTGFLLASEPVRKPPSPKQEDPEAETFQLLRESARAGVKAVSAPQLFETPPELAARMAKEAAPDHMDEILEPSAGTGALVRALLKRDDCAHIRALEINLAVADALRDRYGRGNYNVAIDCCDFLEQNGQLGHILGQYDRVVMNPPFHNGEDIRHIKHALGCLKPGGRLVALCANGPRQQEVLKPLAEASGGFWEDLPAGTFTEQGTNVNAALLVIEA